MKLTGRIRGVSLNLIGRVWVVSMNLNDRLQE